MSFPVRILVCLLLLGPFGCAGLNLLGAMSYSYEDQKIIEVEPAYDGLEGQRVAVVVDAGLDVLYEHPNVVGHITNGISERLAREVPGIVVISPREIVQWQWRTPQWNAMSFGEVANSLGVDRVILVDIREYRLHPPGNRHIWEGVCVGNINIIERDGIDPDVFADSYAILSEFPGISGVTRNSARAEDIERGILADFIMHSSWLFYRHLEPKYPDRYSGPPPSTLDS